MKSPRRQAITRGILSVAEWTLEGQFPRQWKPMVQGLGRMQCLIFLKHFSEQISSTQQCMRITKSYPWGFWCWCSGWNLGGSFQEASQMILPCRHSREHWLEKPGMVAPACNSVSHKTEARSLSWIWGKLGLQSKTSSQRTGGRGGRGRGQHFHSCLVILIYHSTRSRWAVTSSTWVLFLIPLLVLCACLYHHALTSSSVVQGLVALETIEGWLLPHGFGLYLPFSW